MTWLLIFQMRVGIVFDLLVKLVLRFDWEKLEKLRFKWNFKTFSWIIPGYFECDNRDWAIVWQKVVNINKLKKLIISHKSKKERKRKKKTVLHLSFFEKVLWNYKSVSIWV